MSEPSRTPHPLSVLVVDDFADTVESEVELLTFYGHRVRVAFSGAEALRCVAAERPDVVLLDIRMPVLDGFAVARLIRERCAGGKQPILVAVTGCGAEADRRRGAEAGFDLHLTKPVDPALLVGVLERFRRLLTPPVPAVRLAPAPEEPPDRSFGSALVRLGALPAGIH